MPALRPPYWSPEYLLGELREGRSPTELIRQAIADLGEALSTEALWSDVHRWKKQVPGFEAEYREAIRTCYEIRGEPQRSSPGSGRPEDFGPAEQAAFIEEMAANGGNLHQAAYDCGVAPQTVLVRINPKSPRFDKSFAERFYDAEASRGAKLYELSWKHGMKEDENGRLEQPLLHMRLMETRLPHLFSPKRTLEIEGRVHHSHELLPAAVTRQVAETRQALLGPSRQTPEEAIDAEYVEAEAAP